MKYLKPIILILLVFAAGICVGVVSTRYVIRRSIQQAVRRPELVRLRIENNLTRELDLNPEQQGKLDEILVAMQQEIAMARQERLPRFHLILADTQKRISEILTPEQREKFEKLQAEYGLFTPGAQGQGLQRLQRLRNRPQGTP
jgi:Spy/CpxP family protein refolding chaperone